MPHLLSKMDDFHIEEAHQRIGLCMSLPFWVSMLKQSLKVLPRATSFDILDFGCGDGKFLQIVDLFLPLKSGLGVDCNHDLVSQAFENNQNSKVAYMSDDIDNTNLQSHINAFDVMYAQEVLYTLKDLSAHAILAFKLLREGGFYFATMGCYRENPYWAQRKDVIRAQAAHLVHDYSIEDVIQAFYNAGFEVCLKRLPLEYFVVYSPKISQTFGTPLNLLEHCEDRKLLFCFYKKAHENPQCL
ncbi:methyltransferase domain-containing protein [Helicobacter ailurogastricus]|uniref:methyltransferase domain-containing protein n=1 Tax=Helicobacter ailurogastricus TaxID=1578720 RepID=UPI0013154B0E|nr:methyltransferase domain-containing protein [Helicobacter ailurogastricus]